MDKTKKFFNDVASYSGSAFFANILNFITGVVVRKIFQPAMMGLFSEVMLIFDYARYSQLGMIESLDKELPYHYGKKDHKKIEEIKNIGFTFCLATTLCISIAILIASLFFKITTDRLLINGIRIISLMIVFRVINGLYIVLNRSRHNFSVISKYTALTAVLDIGLKIFLVIKFGFYGILWASILTWSIGFLYFYKASGRKFKIIFNFSLAEVARLLKIGFPIFIMGFVYMTLRNIDRIMIIRLLDRESLGFYTIALMVSVYMAQVPNLVYAVIFPRFYQAYGETQDIFAIKDLFVRPTLVFAYFFPILIGIVILGLPLLLKYILPAYMPGLFPAYILLLGCSFVALINMPGYLLIALNKQIYMVAIGIFSIIVGVALIYIFVDRFQFGLAGVAIGTSIAHFLYSTILISVAFRNYTKSFFSHFKFFLELYFPFFWALTALLILRGFVFESSGNFFGDFSVIFYKGLIFLVSCVPLILYGNKRTAILTLLKNKYILKRR